LNKAVECRGKPGKERSSFLTSEMVEILLSLKFSLRRAGLFAARLG
jgi:hypothetical protein